MATSWANGKVYDGQGVAADGSQLRFDRGAGQPCDVPGCVIDHENKKEVTDNGRSD